MYYINNAFRTPVKGTKKWIKPLKGTETSQAYWHLKGTETWIRITQKDHNHAFSIQ